jgi:type IV pilus assembly protein PilY1
VFDLSSSNPDNWGTAYGSNTTPIPLFRAINDAGQAQPISGRPIVTLHPTCRHQDTAPNTLVFFGTGQYLTQNDPLTNGVQSFYGLWDRGATITGSRDVALVEQTFTTDIITVDGESRDVRLISNNPVNYNEPAGPFGWFVDLPENKERVIVNPLIFGELVVYTTLIPAENLCSTSAGTSWLMVHNFADGSEPDITALDVTGDGNFDENDQVQGANVGGVKSGNLYWQPSLVKSGKGAIGTLLLPTDDVDGLDEFKLQGFNDDGKRSSWGRYRFE